MKLFFFIASILFVIIAISCKTSQKVLNQQEIEGLPKVLEFSKSACRGKCPYFDMTIYKDGWMVFNGKRFTVQSGEATSQLSSQEFAQLTVNCRAAGLWSCELEYGMNIQDIPTTTVHFYEKDRDRKVRWRMRAPEALPNLSNQIMELIYARDWVERPKKKTSIKDQNFIGGIIRNELIIQFKEKLDAHQWCEQYRGFGLKVKKPLSTLTPIFLMTFDTRKMPPNKMLDMVKKDKKVATAEFNKRLQARDR